MSLRRVGCELYGWMRLDGERVERRQEGGKLDALW